MDATPESKIGKWKVLESTYVVDRPWLRARRDVVELPTGVVHPEYYVLEYPEWVNTIAITRDGLFVMVEQYRHGLGEVFTELCAGVVEKGEAPIDGARRELMEETGFGGGSWEPWMEISANPGSQNNLTHCFLATGVEPLGSKHLDATEDLRVKLLTESEVWELINSDSLKQSLMAAPLWKYFAMKMRR